MTPGSGLTFGQLVERLPGRPELRTVVNDEVRLGRVSVDAAGVYRIAPHSWEPHTLAAIRALELS